MPASGAAVIPPQTTGLQAQHSGPIRVPPLTNDRIAEYIRLFDRAGSQNGLLSGMKDLLSYLKCLLTPH
jgi:hypothetical protein